ncbi:L,D-transpeptidase Cds6 family protein [Chitinolyticbacter meiyuanensis]|uniref:L,D-transpeptidase Cds6 family protein n=1 Tax=Chitinolyticbacter meiyuanensis TaxID=682798 RepID=UPI001C9E559E|nr:tetratricopeptide repeat protein [Chitinolyticbacter meiyuanensis]
MSFRGTWHLVLPLLLSGFVHAGETDDIRHLVQERDFNAAVERADRFLAKSPKDAQVRFLRALALAELGRTNDAIKAFTSLSEDYPQLPEPYNNLAVLYAQQNQLDKARAALQLSIQTNPSYAIAHENLGDLYARMASQAYDKALQIEGQNRQVATKLTLVRELFSGSAIAPVRPPVVASARPTLAPIAKPTAVPTRAAAPTQPPKPAPTPQPTAKPTLAPTPLPTAVPTPQPTPVETGNDRAVQAATRAVEAWADAWSSQDFDRYVSAYSKKFATAAWAAERKPRVTGPKSISVRLSAIKVTLEGDDRAIVRFRQSYKSDRLSSNTGKTLVLEKSGSRWLIVEERI